MFPGVRVRPLLSALLGTVLVAFLITACSSDSGDADSASATLRFGFVGAGAQYPPDEFGWALTTGLAEKVLAEHGIATIEATPFPTGPDLNEAVIGGRIDVTSSGETPALTARGSGAETRLLALPGTSESLIIANSDGPADITALSGKKVAVVKGSTMHRFLVDALKKNNVEAQIININSTPDSVAALRRGEVDAVATVRNIEAVNAALKSGDVTQIATAYDYPGLESIRAYTVTDSFADGHEGLAAAWSQLRSEALQDIRNRPDDYYDFVAEVTGSPRADVEQLFPLTAVSDQSLDPELVGNLTGTKDFLVSEKLIRKDFDIQQWTLS